INPVHPEASDLTVQAPLPTPPSPPALLPVDPGSTSDGRQHHAVPPTPPEILPTDSSSDGRQHHATPPPIPTMIPDI
ncbi:MAG TPA: hypothetical protein VGK13_08270, partial [Methanocellaceae archaeon]